MNYTFEQVRKDVSINRLSVKREHLIIAQLSWQKRGLQQTQTGYGNKLTTSYKLCFDGIVYRVYSICHSNCSSEYIQTKKYGMIFINIV